MNNQPLPANAVVVCSPEPVYTHQWSVQLAEALGCEFAELQSAHEQESATGLAAESPETQLVLFTRNPQLLNSELARDALILVLLESPSEYVARELAQSTTFTQQKCDEWVKKAQSYLNFFQRNRGPSTVLLTQNDIRTRSEDCLAALNSSGLDLPNLPDLQDGIVDPILELLAGLLVERHARSRNLYEEVLVASSLERQDEELGIDIEPDMGAVAAYLRAQAGMDKKMEQLATASEEGQSELELAHLQIHQLQEELETLHLKSTGTTEEKASSDQHNTVEQDLKSELELALLQIHQLQEELELYYQKYLHECGKPVDLLGQIGGTIGSDTLRVLRMARAAQQCGLGA